MESAADQRAVGQRTDYRCQQPGVFDGKCSRSKYTRVLPTMTGQRSAVQKSAVRSAYCPPPALVAAVSAAMPGSLTAVDRGCMQAVMSSRWLDKQSGTSECRSGMGPSTNTCAPVARSCCTRRVRLSIHAESYGVKPLARRRMRAWLARPAAGARTVTGR